jgi:hypothetical protein
VCENFVALSGRDRLSAFCAGRDGPIRHLSEPMYDPSIHDKPGSVSCVDPSTGVFMGRVADYTPAQVRGHGFVARRAGANVPNYSTMRTFTGFVSRPPCLWQR